MKDLSAYSTEELIAVRDAVFKECDKRRNEADEKLRAAREARASYYLEIIDIIAELVPSHIRNSCSDDNLFNYFWSPEHHMRCQRCYILHAKATKFWDPELRANVYLTEDSDMTKL